MKTKIKRGIDHLSITSAKGFFLFLFQGAWMRIVPYFRVNHSLLPRYSFYSLYSWCIKRVRMSDDSCCYREEERHPWNPNRLFNGIGSNASSRTYTVSTQYNNSHSCICFSNQPVLLLIENMCSSCHSLDHLFKNGQENNDKTEKIRDQSLRWI